MSVYWRVVDLESKLAMDVKLKKIYYIMVIACFSTLFPRFFTAALDAKEHWKPNIP